jgi:hypothetical protein
MPIIQAYQCAQTKKVFVEKTDYLKHLRKQVVARKIQRQLAKDRAELLNEIASMRRLANLREVTGWVVSHSDLFRLNDLQVYNRKWGKRDIRLPTWKFRSLELFGMQFSNAVSNSHCCPVDGVENFEGKPDRPIGYPGWHGRITFELTADTLSFPSDMFVGTGINLGGGGGGKNAYQFEVRLFTADWQGLAGTALIKKVAGGSPSDIV